MLDENNSDDIILYDENNKKVVFEQVAIIPLQNKIYALLKPVTKLPGIEDDQAIVFAIEEVENESVLVVVDDNAIVDKVFEQYYDLLRAEGIDVD